MKKRGLSRTLLTATIFLCMILVTTATYLAACSCDSGGSGATGCSIDSGGSSCSVTCGSGYYACCSYGGVFTLSSCKCSAVGQEIPECHDE